MAVGGRLVGLPAYRARKEAAAAGKTAYSMPLIVCREGDRAPVFVSSVSEPPAARVGHHRLQAVRAGADGSIEERDCCRSR